MLAVSNHNNYHELIPFIYVDFDHLRRFTKINANMNALQIHFPIDLRARNQSVTSNINFVTYKLVWKNIIIAFFLQT